MANINVKNFSGFRFSETTDINCRSVTLSIFGVGVFSNPWIWVGVTTMLLLQLCFVYTPVMHHLFDTMSLGGDAWTRIVAVGGLVYAVVGTEKWLWRRIVRTTGKP